MFGNRCDVIEGFEGVVDGQSLFEVCKHAGTSGLDRRLRLAHVRRSDDDRDYAQAGGLLVITAFAVTTARNVFDRAFEYRSMYL